MTNKLVSNTSLTPPDKMASCFRSTRNSSRLSPSHRRRVTSCSIAASGSASLRLSSPPWRYSAWPQGSAHRAQTSRRARHSSDQHQLLHPFDHVLPRADEFRYQLDVEWSCVRASASTAAAERIPVNPPVAIVLANSESCCIIGLDSLWFQGKGKQDACLLHTEQNHKSSPRLSQRAILYSCNGRHTHPLNIALNGQTTWLSTALLTN